MPDMRSPGEFDCVEQRRPRRISFNFVDRCNMSCPFCYIPFDGMRADAEKAVEVIDTVLRWAPTAITVGGGDPLMYQYTQDLLGRIRRDHRTRPFVQLDSNFARAKADISIPELAPLVDMVGVPLDALVPEISHVMRGDRHHPARIVGLLPRLREEGLCVKINTVVADSNVEHIPALADFVRDAGVHVWSLYEFWAIGETARSQAGAFSLSRERFLRAAAVAAARAPGVKIEVGDVDSRKSAYFFVTPSGRAYTVSDDPSRYEELGNVLTDEELVLKKWREYADFSANELRVRDRRSISASSAFQRFNSTLSRR